MRIELINYPSEDDWAGVKCRALVTIYGKGMVHVPPPLTGWRHRILAARHSPIRFLRYSYFFQDIPSNLATHLARHVHAQPYISSLRPDRQDVMDGDKAPRDTPVNMIYDVNAEELMVIANKRLCRTARKETQDIVREMCRLAEVVTPELKGLLVPMCEYGRCHEMFPCGKGENNA